MDDHNEPFQSAQAVVRRARTSSAATRRHRAAKGRVVAAAASVATLGVMVGYLGGAAGASGTASDRGATDRTAATAQVRTHGHTAVPLTTTRGS